MGGLRLVLYYALLSNLRYLFAFFGHRVTLFFLFLPANFGLFLHLKADGVSLEFKL